MSAANPAPHQRLKSVLLVLFAPLILSPARVCAWQWQSVSGHLKYQLQAQQFPRDSVYQTLFNDSNLDQLLDNRWKFSGQQGHWDLNLDYQLQGIRSDRLQYGLGDPLNPTGVPNDDRRLFNFTHVFSQDDNSAILHRLDRFNIGYTRNNLVLRFGRQVVSWGNGLMFNPMDFFNPFDPAALDKEYKTGDDMLYGQHVLPSGDDLQGVWVVRRDTDDDRVAAADSSVALKYHHWLSAGKDSFWQGAELDLLVAQHYDDQISGLGVTNSIGGAVWRSDLLLTHTDSDTYLSLVSNLSYSWVWNNRNWSGVLEYFYNGLGLAGDEVSLVDVQAKPDLVNRLLRGELYSTGKHYLATSASVELSPLWLATPALFVNLGDQSALLQLGSQYSLAQNWQITSALNVPLGDRGTEYGGWAAGNKTYLSYDLGLFFQLAFYF